MGEYKEALQTLQPIRIECPGIKLLTKLLTFDSFSVLLLCCSTDGPDKITISPLNPSKFLKSGSELKLSCSAESSPAATISWYHNGALLAPKGPQLTLSGMKEKQGGNYSCYAHNAKTLRTNPSAVVSFTVQGE